MLRIGGGVVGEGTFGEILPMIITQTGEVSHIFCKRYKRAETPINPSAQVLRQSVICTEMARAIGLKPDVILFPILDMGDIPTEIYMERCLGNLTDVRKQRYWTDDILNRWCCQALEAMLYLHLCGITHGDCAAENWFVRCDREATLVIADFDSLQSMYAHPEGMSCNGETYRCMVRAPELFVSPYQPNMEKADTWSLGVVIYYILHGTPLISFVVDAKLKEHLLISACASRCGVNIAELVDDRIRYPARGQKAMADALVVLRQTKPSMYKSLVVAQQSMQGRRNGCGVDWEPLVSQCLVFEVSDRQCLLDIRGMKHERRVVGTPFPPGETVKEQILAAGKEVAERWREKKKVPPEAKEIRVESSRKTYSKEDIDLLCAVAVSMCTTLQTAKTFSQKLRLGFSDFKTIQTIARDLDFDLLYVFPR